MEVLKLYIGISKRLASFVITPLNMVVHIEWTGMDPGYLT
jgi:hypothetical protein